MKTSRQKQLLLLIVFVFVAVGTRAQGGSASARIDARQITIGDQAKLFIEATCTPAIERLQWPIIPDSLDKLEIVDKGKIDTIVNGGRTTYRQRLMITGFDSGLFKVPPFQFAVIPTSGNAYVLTSDSFELLVQSVQVDTTKAFKPIKNIIYVNLSWLDYLWYILAALAVAAIGVFATLYFMKRKKPAPPKPTGPVESLQDRTLRLLAELENQQLWQKNQVKEYYVALTELVRGYIEQRFNTPALELTTDELLYKAQLHRELQPYLPILTTILQTADLAKFAKWQPLPQEHFDAMEHAKQLVSTSRPVIIETPTEK